MSSDEDQKPGEKRRGVRADWNGYMKDYRAEQKRKQAAKDAELAALKALLSVKDVSE